MLYFFLLSLSLALYLFFYSLIYLVENLKAVRIFYILSSLGWLAFPYFTLLFILSLLEDGRKFLEKWKFFLAVLLLPLYFWVIRGRFLITEFIYKGGFWLESNRSSIALIAWYSLVIVFYLCISYRFIKRENHKLERMNRTSVLLRILNPLYFSGLIILLLFVILPRFLSIKIPGLIHFLASGFYVYLSYVVFTNRLEFHNPNQILRLIFRDEKINVFSLTREGFIRQVIYLSPDFLHWRKKELLESPFREFFDGSMSEKGFREKWLAEEITNAEARMIDKSGRSVSVILSIRQQLNRYKELQGFMVTIRDHRQVSQLKENLKRLSGSNTELRDRAIKDPLTGIYNRAKFLSSLERESFQIQHYSTIACLIMFDIDHFKRVNDTFGHDMGDYVLCEVVASIASGLRETDLFSRWGGEEFIILCRNTQLKQALTLAERLRERLENHPFKEVGHITASFGVSSYRRDESRESLLKRVDENLYKAKKSGRNQVVSDEEPSPT